MKNIFAAVLLGLILTSCSKLKDDKTDWNFPCDLGTCVECASDSYEDPGLVGSDHTIHYLEPIIWNEEGTCIVGGFVKYLKDGKTVALVRYGLGEDGNYGIKTLCVNGDCEDQQATTCTFENDCVVTEY